MEQTSPNVFINQQVPTSPKKTFQFKYLVMVFAVVLLVESAILVTGLIRNQAGSSSTPTNAPIAKLRDASLVLTTSNKDIVVGDNVPVTVKLSTGEHTVISTDLILNFDPKALSASSSAITNGTIFDLYPAPFIDNKKGIVGISGVSTDKGFKGEDILSTINFKTLQKGSTKISIDFKKDTTVDSNVLDGTTNSDILNSVTNLDIQIR